MVFKEREREREKEPIKEIFVKTTTGTYISKENLCLAPKSAGVNSRSIFALMRDTVNRIPVNMLYAVT